MDNKKNIDRLFQEKLKDFEAAPSNDVWGRINQTIHGKRKKRRVVPFWLQLGGAAAILLLLLTVGGVFNSNKTIDPDSNTTIVESDTATQKDSKLNSSGGASSELTSSDSDTKVVNDSYEDKSESSSSRNVSRLVDTDSRPSEQKKNAPGNSHKSMNSSDVTVTTNTINNPLSPSNSTDDISTQNKNESLVKNTNELKNLVKNLTKNETVVASTSEEKNAKNEELQSSNSLDNKNSHLKKLEDQIQDNALENAIAQAEDVLTNEKEKELKNRWSVSPKRCACLF